MEMWLIGWKYELLVSGRDKNEIRVEFYFSGPSVLTDRNISVITLILL